MNSSIAVELCKKNTLGPLLNNRVLVVDDDPFVLDNYQASLTPYNQIEEDFLDPLLHESGIALPEKKEKFFQVDYANSGTQAIELVKKSLENRSPYAVIFMDVRMPPGIDGVAASVQIRQIDPDPYIVFVTAFSDYSADQMHQQLDQNMMLITKPFSDDVIRQTARMLCSNWCREHSLQQAYDQLQAFSNLMSHQATHDGLTGLYNRHYLNETLDKEVRRAYREQQPIGILMIDVDRFKWYNDYYGHLYGDQTLHSIAHQLISTVKRPTDSVARFGGEEFCIILPNTDGDGTKIVAAKICQGIEALGIEFPESDIAATVTVSIGGICCIPREQDNSRSLLASADQLLYQVKEKGRNSFEVSTPSTEENCPQAIIPIEWNDNLSVGHHLMDQQHKELIKIVNQIQDLINSCSTSMKTTTQILQLLNHFLSTFEAHCRSEEALMEQAEFPGLHEQREMHQRIETLLTQRLVDGISRRENLIAITNHLSGWFLQHVLVEDMQYKSYVETLDSTA